MNPNSKEQLRQALIALLSFKLETDEPTNEDLIPNQSTYKFLQ